MAREQITTSVEPELYDKFKKTGQKNSYALMVGMRTIMNLDTAYSEETTKQHHQKVYKLIQKIEEQSQTLTELQGKLQAYQLEEEKRME